MKVSDRFSTGLTLRKTTIVADSALNEGDNVYLTADAKLINKAAVIKSPVYTGGGMYGAVTAVSLASQLRVISIQVRNGAFVAVMYKVDTEEEEVTILPTVNSLPTSGNQGQIVVTICNFGSLVAIHGRLEDRRMFFINYVPATDSLSVVFTSQVLFETPNNILSSQPIDALGKVLFTDGVDCIIYDGSANTIFYPPGINITGESSLRFMDFDYAAPVYFTTPYAFNVVKLSSNNFQIINHNKATGQTFSRSAALTYQGTANYTNREIPLTKLFTLPDGTLAITFGTTSSGGVGRTYLALFKFTADNTYTSKIFELPAEATRIAFDVDFGLILQIGSSLYSSGVINYATVNQSMFTLFNMQKFSLSSTLFMSFVNTYINRHTISTDGNVFVGRAPKNQFIPTVKDLFVGEAAGDYAEGANAEIYITPMAVRLNLPGKNVGDSVCQVYKINKDYGVFEDSQLSNQPVLSYTGGLTTQGTVGIGYTKGIIFESTEEAKLTLAASDGQRIIVQLDDKIYEFYLGSGYPAITVEYSRYIAIHAVGTALKTLFITTN